MRYNYGKKKYLGCRYRFGDAVAIMVAILAEDIQLEAVCSVAGNKELDMTTENTLRVVQLMGADVPVYRGCPEPLVKFLCPDRLEKQSRGDRGKMVDENGKVHMMHSDYLEIPAVTIHEQKISAPEFYVQYLRESQEKVTLVAVGPLTNLAVALTMDPKITEKIEEIVIMGGGYNITNVSPTAEFNIWYDPGAAQRVLHCGAKITLVPFWIPGIIPRKRIAILRLTAIDSSLQTSCAICLQGTRKWGKAMAIKVIMDVDTGSDDAVAIMTAATSPDIDLVAICAVWGNKAVENTTDNTLRLIDALGLKVPVYKGCDTAMVKYLTNDFVPTPECKPVMYQGKPFQMHAEHLDLPEAKSKPEAIPAACFYVDYLRNATEKVTLVPVAP